MPGRDWQAEISLLQERERKAQAILGVSEAADKQDIHRAFRRASLSLHPDMSSGDVDSSRRFHLACCAYKFLTEGEACTALDELDAPPPLQTHGKYRMDNPWGYWCWWRACYFGTYDVGDA